MFTKERAQVKCAARLSAYLLRVTTL